MEGKRPDRKDQASAKSSKKMSANTGSKARDNGKASSGSGNDGISQRFGKPLVNFRSSREFVLLCLHPLYQYFDKISLTVLKVVRRDHQMLVMSKLTNRYITL